MTTALNHKNRVQVTQLSKLQRIISARKQCQSRKRMILRGETILATPRMLLKLEGAASASKSNKQNPLNPSTPLPPNIDPSLVLNSLDPESDNEALLDCIIVTSNHAF